MRRGSYGCVVVAAGKKLMAFSSSGQASCRVCSTVQNVDTENFLSDASQNVRVILCVNSLILEGKFMLHNPISVKENHQLVLCSTPDLTCTNNSL